MRSGVAQTWCVSLRLFRVHAAINFVSQPLSLGSGQTVGWARACGAGARFKLAHRP